MTPAARAASSLQHVRCGRVTRLIAPRGMPFMLAVAVLTAGCPPRDGASIHSGGSTGPPRSQREIIEQIQSNAAKLDAALWSSSVTATARLIDDRKQSHVFNVEGNLLHVPPRGFRMDLRHGIGPTVIGLGSNDDTFWIWIEPELHVMRWGHHRNAGRPCCASMPVRPDQLVSALALGGLPGAEPGFSGPILRAGRIYDILTYTVASTGEIREYYVERSPPHLVRLVRFRDASRRDVLSVYLEEFRPAWPDGPLLPHAASVFWPLDDARFVLRIGGYQPRSLAQVSPRAFVMPDRETLPDGIRAIIQIDADCEPLKALSDD